MLSLRREKIELSKTGFIQSAGRVSDLNELIISNECESTRRYVINSSLLGKIQFFFFESLSLF